MAGCARWHADVGAVTRGNSLRHRWSRPFIFDKPTPREETLRRRESLQHVTTRHQTFELTLQFCRIDLSEHASADAMPHQLADQALTHQPRPGVLQLATV
jgi:hypothetical protein